jgi:hypothetical protein
VRFTGVRARFSTDFSTRTCVNTGERAGETT